MTCNSFHVFFMCNRPCGVLFCGLTDDLIRSVIAHRKGYGSAFTRQYNIRRLVWIESHPNLEAAVLRHKRIRDWNRDWKLNLIEPQNPNWQDLFPSLLTRSNGLAPDAPSKQIPACAGIRGQT